jgi:phosphoribosylaminoimidazole-succinocarboxamide synthase
MSEATPTIKRADAVDIRKGAKLAEGKTKEIYAVEGDADHAIVAYKNTITAFDNPEFTRTFDTKAKYSNITTSRVFEMLNTAGVPTSFVRQVSDTEFLSERCAMIPLEVVIRRYAYGSFLTRHPELKQEGKVPHRFDAPTVEFFLKTTKGGLTKSDGTVLVEGLDPLKGEEDPMIEDAHAGTWNLVHPKKQQGDPARSLNRTVEAAQVLGTTTASQMEDIITRTLSVLESFFEKEGFHLVDFKIEFGVTRDGRLVIADVIDNDSWRLRDTNWDDVSKQSFRDGAGMDEVEGKYALVANLLERSRH